MNQRKLNKGPIPTPRGPQSKRQRRVEPQQTLHPYHPYHPCYDWYEYDWYDWYDYDWYDWYDYDDWNYYLAANKAKRANSQRPAPNKPAQENYTDLCLEHYQQGFKDGWKAGMDYMMYGTEVQEPPMPPTPTPTPTPPKPMEGDEE